MKPIEGRDVLLRLPTELEAQLDEYRYANRIETRSEAIRRLIRAGLDAATHVPVKRKAA